MGNEVGNVNVLEEFVTHGNKRSTSTSDLRGTRTLEGILKQLVKLNFHMSIITDTCINDKDVEE